MSKYCDTVSSQCIFRGCREDLLVKRVCCSYREFKQVQVLEPMPGSSHQPLPPVSGDMTPSSCFHRYPHFMYGIHLHKQIHMHK